MTPPDEAFAQFFEKFIGHIDASFYDAVVRIRGPVLTDIFKVFNVTGGGIVTIPLRIALLGVLLWRRRWGAATAFAIAWLVSEVGLELLGIPSRPSADALVTTRAPIRSHRCRRGRDRGVRHLAFLHGVRRRSGSYAIAFAFVMAFSASLGALALRGDGVLFRPRWPCCLRGRRRVRRTLRQGAGAWRQPGGSAAMTAPGRRGPNPTYPIDFPRPACARRGRRGGTLVFSGKSTSRSSESYRFDWKDESHWSSSRSVGCQGGRRGDAKLR
jgi:hypothetical protein